jgi:hypothetical protein
MAFKAVRVHNFDEALLSFSSPVPISFLGG